MRTMFSAVDAENNGEINFAEFLQLMATLKNLDAATIARKDSLSPTASMIAKHKAENDDPEEGENAGIDVEKGIKGIKQVLVVPSDDDDNAPPSKYAVHVESVTETKATAEVTPDDTAGKKL